jgi:hypothetical protein
MLIINI